MTITGKKGVLRVEYQLAMTFRDWCLTSKQEKLGTYSSVLRGKIVSMNKVWLLQGPLVLELCLGSSWWQWKDDLIIPNISELKEGNMFELYTEGNPTIK